MEKSYSTLLAVVLQKQVEKWALSVFIPWTGVSCDILNRICPSQVAFVWSFLFFFLCSEILMWLGNYVFFKVYWCLLTNTLPCSHIFHQLWKKFLDGKIWRMMWLPFSHLLELTSAPPCCLFTNLSLTSLKQNFEYNWSSLWTPPWYHLSSCFLKGSHDHEFDAYPLCPIFCTVRTHFWQETSAVYFKGIFKCYM